MTQIAYALGLILSAVGGPQDVRQVGLWSRSLYQTMFTVRDPAGTKSVHDAALRYVHRAPAKQLEAELKAALRTYGLKSPEGAGAAYLMAMHRIDLDKNIDLLGNLDILKPDVPLDTAVSWPEAMADIALRCRSVKAIRMLVDKPLDAHPAETRDEQVARLFAANPDLVALAVSQSPTLTAKFVPELKFGTGWTKNGWTKAQSLASRRIRTSRGNVRAVFEAVVKHRPS